MLRTEGTLLDPPVGLGGRRYVTPLDPSLSLGGSIDPHLHLQFVAWGTAIRNAPRPPDSETVVACFGGRRYVTPQSHGFTLLPPDRRMGGRRYVTPSYVQFFRQKHKKQRKFSFQFSDTITVQIQFIVSR